MGFAGMSDEGDGCWGVEDTIEEVDGAIEEVDATFEEVDGGCTDDTIAE